MYIYHHTQINQSINTPPTHTMHIRVFWPLAGALAPAPFSRYALSFSGVSRAIENIKGYVHTRIYRGRTRLAVRGAPKGTLRTHSVWQASPCVA